MDGSDPVEVTLAFVRAAQDGDLAAMRSLMADSFQGHVTTADAGVRQADREQYLASIEAMDVRSANLRLETPNVLRMDPGRVLVMVEVRAERFGHTLHNFSGQLAQVADGRITELWMVEALPAESDAFWSRSAP